jgi:short-subunit dehydrogenase
MPSRFPYQSALVTGASSGIGAGLCRRLAAEGVGRIAVVARRQDRLEALAQELSCEVTPVVADLETDAGLRAVMEAVPEVDLLVNNAGFGHFGRFAEADPERQARMVALNCQAPVRLTGHYLPPMVRRGHGAVLTVSSSQAFQPVPYMSTYAASKAFLLHWSEGLREELRGTSVRMVTMCPGATPTEFNGVSGVPEANLRVMALVSSRMDDVLDRCIDQLRHDRALSVPGFGNRALTALGSLFPRALTRRVVALVLQGSARRQVPEPAIQRPAE